MTMLLMCIGEPTASMLREVDEDEIRALEVGTAECETELLDDSSSQNTGMTTDHLWLGDGDGDSDTDVDAADSDPISSSSVADLLSLPLVQAEQLERMLAALAQQISCYDEATIASIPCNNSNTSQHHFHLKHSSTVQYSVFNHQAVQPGSLRAIEDSANYVTRPLLHPFSVFSRSLTVITSAGGLRLGGREHTS